MAVLKDIGSVDRFTIALDYMSEEVVAGTTGDEPTTEFVGRFAAMGAPWSFGLNDLGALAAEAGLAWRMWCRLPSSTAPSAALSRGSGHRQALLPVHPQQGRLAAIDLERGRHLGEFGDGVNVARGARLGGGDLQLRARHALAVMDVDLAGRAAPPRPSVRIVSSAYPPAAAH